MSMDNPFRAQVHQTHQSSSRKVWNFVFVTALGLTVLWLSWTLLLDDIGDGYDDSAIETERGTFLDEEDDTEILSKDTRLRSNAADPGELEDDAKPLPKSVKTKAPVRAKDEDDDENENIGEDDHHDEDTLTHEDRLHRDVEKRKTEQEAKKQLAKTDDDDLNLTPEYLQKLAEEDHEDDDDPVKPTKLQPAETAKPKANPAVLRATQPPRKPEAPVKPKPAADDEGIDHDALISDDDDALVGDDDAEDEVDAKPNEAPEPKQNDEADDDDDAVSEPAKTKATSKKATQIEDNEEAPMPEDDDDHVQQAKAAKSSEKFGDDDDESHRPVTKKLLDKKTKTAPIPLDDEESEVDEDDGEALPARSSNLKKTPRVDEPSDDDEELPSVKVDRKSPPKVSDKSGETKITFDHIDDDDEDVPPGPPPSDDDAEEDYMAVAAGKTSSSAKATIIDDEDVLGESDESQSKPLQAKKPTNGRPSTQDDNEDDEDEVMSVRPTPLKQPKTTFEEPDEKGLFEQPLKPVKKDAPKKDQVTDVVEADLEEDDEQHPALLEHEEEEDDNDDNDGVALGNKPVPAEADEDTGSVQQTKPSCDMLRKKSDCDSREDCKWKYPKTETKGFFCLARESCEDPVSQKKSHCLGLPNCAWVRVSHSSYGCRAVGTPDHQSTVSDDAHTSESPPSTPIKSFQEEVDEPDKADEDDDIEPSHESGAGIDCDLHERKAKCVGDHGCSWVRISTSPTKYGCRSTSASSDTLGEDNEESIEENLKVLDNDEIDEEVKLASDEKASDESTKLSSFTEKVVEDPSDDEGEVQVNEDDAGADEADVVAEVTSAPLTVCSSIRVKSACQLRTDCYWKYPVSYSSGKYCTERQLSIKVAPEKAQLYEALVSGRQSLYDDGQVQPVAPGEGSQSRWKVLGPDWKRHRTDVSCSLHPECLSRDNVTRQYYPAFPGLEVPSTYVRAQCCSVHPPLRSLFLQVSEFLNREGIPWWMSAKDSQPSLFADGFLLPWTSQITIEVAIFGSKSALDYAATSSLRANLTSYTTTRTRVLRSTKNEFASKLLQFNADPQHLPNTMRVCLAKFVAGSKASSSSYSQDWLRSELSGAEQCLVVSKSSKIPSSKTPTYFLVSHIDEIDGKGPSIKIVPRIFRTASSDACLEVWRPGQSTGGFSAVPMNLVFPTSQCFGHGKFQGFTGVARCARDPKAFLAWEMAASGDDRFLSSEAKSNLEELRKWVEVDYCHRGIVKVSNP